MDEQPINNHHNPNPVFGFLSTETNTFYAFENQTDYQNFI